ncbi:MAG: c-type cytochrome [Akkermansiaceae bacterium]|nr:c-type cytochrome [Akkermansiaceae bacterium]
MKLEMLGSLARVDFSKLNKDQQLQLLRAQGLLICRVGQFPSNMGKVMISQLDRHYPSKDRVINRELCRMLCYLQSPTVVEKTLRLMTSDTVPVVPDWAILARRNASYGKAIIAMLENQPSAQNLHYVYCLRVVKGPWTEGQRRQYFEWFLKAVQKSGGRSYRGFINNLRKDAMGHATQEERKKILSWKLVADSNPFENLPTVKGPGKNWKIKDITGLGDLSKADIKNGERMYRASLCAACHQVKGRGGAAGPDLTFAANRFQLKDFAEAIIEPNKVISDQYHFSMINKKDGSFATGKIVGKKDGFYIVATSPFDMSKTIEIAEGDVKNIKPSPVSPMPPALINRLNKKELTDLMGYLMSLK